MHTKIFQKAVIGGKSQFPLPETLLKIMDVELAKMFEYHQIMPVALVISEKDVLEKAHSLFEDLNIASRLHHKPSQLSGGESQRVAVARALINSPKIIYADEPTGNLDSKNADALHQLFFDLRDKYHQTFVIVTHNSVLAESTDRKLVMKDGQIVL